MTFTDFRERFLGLLPVLSIKMYRGLTEQSEAFELRLANLEREDPPSEKEIVEFLENIKSCAFICPGDKSLHMMRMYRKWEKFYSDFYNKPCPVDPKKINSLFLPSDKR